MQSKIAAIPDRAVFLVRALVWFVVGCLRRELFRVRAVCSEVIRATSFGGRSYFLSRSQHGDVAAILKRFSSSSLPPSFASGRCATTFLAQGTANGSALLFSGEVPA
jgi:hypothetical protein